MKLQGGLAEAFNGNKIEMCPEFASVSPDWPNADSPGRNSINGGAETRCPMFLRPLPARYESADTSVPKIINQEYEIPLLHSSVEFLSHD